MLNILIEENGGTVFITVTPDRMGKDFNFGSSKFKASNGFVIESYGLNVRLSPRLSKFYFPNIKSGNMCMSLSLGCGENRTFIRDLDDAVQEYNSIVHPKLL